jgi:WD40 repeat protein
MNNSSEADTYDTNLILKSFFFIFRNILTLKRILELPDEPLGAAISPNGKFAVFALLDNTARIYYIDSLKFFVSLYGHSLPVYCVDISPVFAIFL